MQECLLPPSFVPLSEKDGGDGVSANLFTFIPFLSFFLISAGIGERQRELSALILCWFAGVFSNLQLSHTLSSSKECRTADE